MPRGLFVTFEGGEGVGKTTQIGVLRDWLQQQGCEVVLTREPGGTVVGEAVRNLVLDRSLPPMHEDTELLLIFAARAEHYRRLIEPALEAGKVVISDRFADASVAYQGFGRQMPLARIAQLCEWVLGEFQPDATFYFRLPLDIGMQRAGKRATADRFEAEALAFFQRVERGYEYLLKRYPQRIRVIDASGSIDDVASRIRAGFPL